MSDAAALAEEVAVVVPACNAAGTIDAALGAVAGQTLRPAEVILVDDGSGDDTAVRAERWAPLLPITVIRQPNAGPASARRRAVAETSCTRIALLDADDVWMPDHLELLVAAHRIHGGIISPNGLRWCPGSEAEPWRHQDMVPVPPLDRQRFAILQKNFVSISALFNREDGEAVGGFRDGFTAAEDWDLWIRMIRAGVRVHAISRPTFLYRVTSTGLTASERVHQVYVAVLEAAADEGEADELPMIERSLRWYRHRSALADAHAAARRGTSSTARKCALRAFTGSASMALQSMGLLIAPITTTAWRDRRRARIL